MDHFAGLDVSVEETSICIVDETALEPARSPQSGAPIGRGYHLARESSPLNGPAPEGRTGRSDGHR